MKLNWFHYNVKIPLQALPLKIKQARCKHERYEFFKCSYCGKDKPRNTAINTVKKMKTMNDEYHDGSTHEVCPKCGLCITCEDCKNYGCKEQYKTTTKPNSVHEKSVQNKNEETGDKNGNV